MKSESGHPSHKDAIALLKADHVKVKTAFQVYESLSEKSYATKKKLADSICADLRIHTLVEEEIFYPQVKSALKETITIYKLA
ncbi:MAG: hemerythrin domain-containing protein, partial [Pseudomonadota bacterium]